VQESPSGRGGKSKDRKKNGGGGRLEAVAGGGRIWWQRNSREDWARRRIKDRDETFPVRHREAEIEKADAVRAIGKRCLLRIFQLAIRRDDNAR